MFKNIIDRLAGSPYERELEQYKAAVDQVTAAASDLDLQALPDESLGALTDLFKARIHIERQQALQSFLDTAEQETVSNIPSEAIQTALKDIPLTGEQQALQDIPPAAEQMELRSFLHTAQEAIKTILGHLPTSERKALDESLRAAEQEALDYILPEAFAAVREASVRTIGLRHYDVQIIGGLVLHQGKIAEMRTGEGKTLVATLPLYLNALTGRGAHLVTVNDYLARRDGGWMGAIYYLLGLSVGVIGKEQYSAIYDPDYVDPGGDLNDERLVHWRPTLRKECYLADITYGTSSEFGFDYLRDNTTVDPARLVQREHVYVIVDEVDSVLIDGARTPLIISGPAGKPSGFYQRFAGIVDKARLRRTTNVDELDFEEPNGDYILDDRTQSISLTDRGIEKVESQLTDILDLDSGQSLYDPQFYHLVHYLENALKAKYIFHRDKQYIVHEGRIVLIDQTTGRPMPSRRYSEGLHQAIEAKEGVQVRREDVTIATITVQNYFRLYKKLSGMTGTALTQAEEFDEVYTLEVVGIPTNVEFKAANGDLIAKKEKVENALPSIIIWETDQSTPVTAYVEADDGDQLAFFRRVDFEDQVYININAKFGAVAHEIKSLHEMGRPVLVGTGSVEASEELARLLKKMGLPHEVLNAKNHDREALIVAQAGRPGAITISTSMAGRGTDILLGGNPEGLAATALAEKTFNQPALHQIVAAVVEGNGEKAREEARNSPLMDDAVVDWVEAGYAELARKAEVEDILQEVVKDLQQDAAYRNAPYETLVRLVQQINLSAVDPGRLDKAREIAESVGVPLSLIPEINHRLDEYRSLSGLMGQAGLIDTLTNRLFEQHYNARAALVREVLSGNLDEAQRIIGQIPGLPESLIDQIQDIQNDCRNARHQVWQAGGLHVIGTERHEARRIDNQLRGRAARQGDPGSSRFYLSMEDELVVRFGGERAKRMMERLNMPEDLPISASILSNTIEQWQSRFEGYYFDMRKNLVEYDEAVNIQRQTVYDERNLILTGDGADLDLMVRNFIAETLDILFERLDAGYEAWAMSEIESVITDFSNLETGEVNTRGVVRRVQPLIPRLSEEELQDILSISDDQELTDTLHELVLDGIDEGHNLRLLIGEIARIVPIWPVLPAIVKDGVPGWEFYVNRVLESFDRYAENLGDDWRDEARQTLVEGLEQAFRNAITLLGQGAVRQDLQKRFFGQIGLTLDNAFLTILSELEYEDLIEALLARVDELLELIRYPKDGADGNGSRDVVQRAEASVYGIGAEEVVYYERALMLNVIDTEWRQYLRAIDDLRQGAGLEAFGQRDPKIEFKRRAFDMFDKLREDVRSGIARGFFHDLPRHRQIIEHQKQQEALLDNLAQSGYRVERKVTRKGGRTKVSQTIHKDLWSKVGRNDPCPCGSGKKFKDCHYHQVRKQQQTVQQDSVVRTTTGGRKRKRRR